MVHRVLVSSARRVWTDLRSAKERSAFASRRGYRSVDRLGRRNHPARVDCPYCLSGLPVTDASRDRGTASRSATPALIAGRHAMSHFGTIIHLMYGDRSRPRDRREDQSACSRYGRVAALHHERESCRAGSLGATTAECRSGRHSLHRFYRSVPANRRPIPDRCRIT